MKEQYYLRIEDESIGFAVEGIHKITEQDIPITKEEYNKFFELQGVGKQFRVKEKPTGNKLFDYIEEFKVEPIVDLTPSTEARINALELALLEVL